MASYFHNLAPPPRRPKVLATIASRLLHAALQSNEACLLIRALLLGLLGKPIRDFQPNGLFCKLSERSSIKLGSSSEDVPMSGL